jgi:hypothetical protein
MNIFFPFIGILTKADRDGKGGGDPVKQYYSKDTGYNRRVRMFA